MTNTFRRRSIRLRGYDYRQAGAYFVTICANKKALASSGGPGMGGARMGDACVALNPTPDPRNVFGHIENGIMVLNRLGRIIEERWDALPEHHPNVVLDEFVVMPDHVHFVVFLVDMVAFGATGVMGATQASPLRDVGATGTLGAGTSDVGATGVVGATQASPLRGGSLGVVVGSFKSGVTRCFNELHVFGGVQIWQRNYYERIIRNELALGWIREYIINNPARWDRDRFNPDRQFVNLGRII